MASDVTGLERALWELAADARWFSGRSRGGRPTGLELGDWVQAPDPGPGIRPATLEVSYPTGEVEKYLVPLVHRPAGTERAPELQRETVDGVTWSIGELADDEDAAADLLVALAEGRDGFTAARDVPAGLSARRYGGEQSNTTIFFGDQVLAKLFRRLEDGPNPDVELHEALADTGAVAALYGTWRRGDTDLAIFLETLPDPADGYVLASRHAADGADFTDHARALGEGLATIHRALADRLPTATQSLAELADGLLARFEAAAAEVGDLEQHRGVVTWAYTALGDGDVTTTRIHGDCHLGQVLWSAGRWVYVDFEGEPLRTIAERRLPDTPWRDVAGMLRSFHYAAASTGTERDAWHAACREAFLDGYGARAGTNLRLLRALEVDKAVYEVVYETRNRPAWRHVPLDFLASLHRED